VKQIISEAVGGTSSKEAAGLVRQERLEELHGIILSVALELAKLRLDEAVFLAEALSFRLERELDH
jgi:hypothetical protein